MREFLFRGKRTDNGEWVCGYYTKARYFLNKKEMHIIFEPDVEAFPHCEFTGYEEVIPETVGQFTGLTDKNGVRIFEGDIVEVHYNPSYGGVAKERIGIFIVEFYKGCFMKRKNGTYTYYHFIPTDEHTVIGNIFDDDPICEQISIFEGGGNDG